MKITKANGKIEYQLIETLKKRNQETDNKIVKRVSSIIKGVKEGGDEAVREYTVRFDGSAPKKSVVEREELFEYLANADSEFRTALENAQKNIYEFHKRQIQQSWMTT
ncbi:MAG: histidinol dehydrogenase, partial [Eubacterium sp.]|nr:histidinol dehydrogenase [Eubacterium sp.]